MGGAYPQTPLEACALGAQNLSAFGAKKNLLFSFKRGWKLCTFNLARDFKLITDNKKHFD